MTPRLYDLSAPAGMREIVGTLCMGYNYRLYTEGETRTQLLDAYSELLSILRDLPNGAGYDAWMEALREKVGAGRGRLEWWLLGLGKKTADNLGVNRENRLEYLDEVGSHLRELSRRSDGPAFEDAMLMLWAGAATLTIRGSRKSSVGKRLETAFLRAGLSVLGLDEDVDYWLGMRADAEVDREVDAEIETHRGRIRLEMGLIEAGNPEVIMDKVHRVGTRGMVIFDRLNQGSSASQVAANNQVAFIQIRNNRPLQQMYEHLVPLARKELSSPPSSPDGIREALAALPDALFAVGQ